MIDTAVCLFPDTLPKEDIISSLVQVFQTIVYLQPVENEASFESGALSPLLVQLINEQRLLPVTPAPFPDLQRERFLSLIEDMRRYGQDYLAQLSFLTLAEMPRHRGMESGRGESGHAILGELLGRSRINVAEEDERVMLLWQSRLILKLGEFYDARQAELQAALRAITERQQSLLADLQGDLDETEELLPLSDLAPESGLSDMLKYRLRAWTRLFFSGPLAPQPELFLTRQDVALDLLAEVYNKRYGQEVRLIAEFSPVEEDFSFQPRDDNADSLEEKLILYANQASQRKKALTSRQRGRFVLRFFSFPGCSPQNLFHESFCSDTPLSQQNSDSERTTLVGLIQTY